MWLAVCFLAVAQCTPATAQPGLLLDDEFCGDCCEHDLQLFSPLDFDFDCQPIKKDCGWYFGYEKLSWSFSNDRIRVGTDGTSTGSLNPWRIFNTGGGLGANPIDPDDDDLAFLPGTEILIPAPALPSAIDSAVPRSEFAWGERYEFGRYDGDTGWLMSILDGPEQNASAAYGFGFTPQDTTIAVINGLPSNIPNDLGIPNNQLLSPLGSVIIVFDDPLNLMLGFLDVVDGTFTATPPGGALTGDSNGDGVLDIGDGFADDIDKDGQHGPDGFVSDTAFVPDVDFITAPADFDDLIVLPTSFQRVNIQNRTSVQGVEIMRSYRLSNKHKMTKNQNDDMELSLGLRYMKFDDSFIVNASGGVLGESFWDTKIVNNLVGPQVALKWSHQKKRIRYDLHTRVMLGYNALDWEQTSALGEDLITGQHNHPLYFQPTYAHHGKRTDDFSPLLEFRGQATYQFTSAIAVKLGYNATFIDNIRRASEQVKYELPRMGFIDGGTQEIFISGVNMGFDVMY